MTDTDLDEAILSGDTKRLTDWFTEHAQNLTTTQATKLIPLVNASHEVCQAFLGVIAPMLGAYFTSHGDSLKGMNVALVRFVQHLQFRMSQQFKGMMRLMDLLSGDQPGGTVQEEATEVADLFRKKSRETSSVVFDSDDIAKKITVDRAARVLAVLEVASMLAPEIQDIPNLRWKVWVQNRSAMAIGSGRKPEPFGSSLPWEEEKAPTEE